MLPDEQPGPEQLAAWRAMTPRQKWAVAQQTYWAARRLKAAFLRSQHPEWSDARVDEAVRQAFLYARS